MTNIPGLWNPSKVSRIRRAYLSASFRHRKLWLSVAGTRPVESYPLSPYAASRGERLPLGDRWPPNGDYHGVRLGLPRVLDPRSPGQVVALAGERHTAGREIYAERATDQDDEC